MRIAFMVGSFPALSETFVLNQITTLIDRGHDVAIFAERTSSDSEEHPDVERYDLMSRVRYESLPESFVGRAWRLPGIARVSPSFLRALDVRRFGATAASLRLAWAEHWVRDASDFDIIQCHFGALGLKAVLLREIGALHGKIATAFHGVDITEYPGRFAGNVYAPLFAHGDLFLPISARWNDAMIAMGCPPEKIVVHRMGVDLRNFPLRQSANETLRPLHILTVGRLVEKKGIADALRAVAASPLDCEYIIAGDGPLRSQLEALARALGLGARVRFVGARTRVQVAELLQWGDVFLAPSVTARDGDIEGIPVTIMEAMATGLPVISTNHSAIPELVAHGVSGFLVKEHDVPAIASHLATLAQHSGMRDNMGREGRAIVERDYNVATLTARLEAMYEKLTLVAGGHAG